MSRIDVEKIGDSDYRVTVREGDSSTTHTVTVGEEESRLAASSAVEDLVEASFRFLLDREPKESILRSFDLGVISRYFPEYESRIGDYLEKR